MIKFLKRKFLGPEPDCDFPRYKEGQRRLWRIVNEFGFEFYCEENNNFSIPDAGETGVDVFYKDEKIGELFYGADFGFKTGTLCFMTLGKNPVEWYADPKISVEDAIKKFKPIAWNLVNGQ